MISRSSAAYALHDSPKPQTLLFPGVGDPAADEMQSLRWNFDRHYKPDLEHSSKAHLQKFLTVIDHWELQHAKSEHPDGPPVCMINDDELRDFRNWLIKSKPDRKCGAVTADQYADYLGAILRRLGPRDSRNRRGKGIIEIVPFCDPLPKPRSRPRVASIEELGRWYKACKHATWPKVPGIPAPLWWRTMLVMQFTYGFRNCDLLPVKVKGKGLLRECVSFDKRPPEFFNSQATCPNGWICYTPQKTQKSKGEHLLPISAIVRKHLNVILATTNASYVLPAPTHYWNWKREAERLQKIAKIEKPYTMQNLRQTSGSHWWRIDSELARYILGHAPRGVTERFYIDQHLTIAKRIDELPLPEEFHADP